MTRLKEVEVETTPLAFGLLAQLAQFPSFPGRQFSQIFFAFTQAHPLQEPDLLHLQHAIQLLYVSIIFACCRLSITLLTSSRPPNITNLTQRHWYISSTRTYIYTYSILRTFFSLTVDIHIYIYTVLRL